MKRPRENKKPTTMFGKFIGLVEQIREENFCDRAIGVLKRFIQNERLYQDTMAAFFVQNNPKGIESLQALYAESCRLKQQVENLKVALFEETNVQALENIENMIRTLEAKIGDNLKEYSKFSTLLGDHYCANPGNINQDIQNKVNHQLQRLPARQPISDSELLHAYHHYAGSTSNRTVGGTLATSIVTYFIDRAAVADYPTTHKVAETYITLTRMAANREKFLRPSDTTVDMDDARAIFKDLNAKIATHENSTARAKLIEMQKKFKWVDMPEELRAAALEIYLADFNEQLDGALLDLQKLIAVAADQHPECLEEISAMSAEIRSVFDAVESERHTIEQFNSKI